MFSFRGKIKVRQANERQGPVTCHVYAYATLCFYDFNVRTIRCFPS